MAKKKATEVVYTPYGDVSQVPSIVQQTIQQIPPYEDSGVRYQGKYKIQQTETRYELKAQETRFYTLGIGGGSFGSTLFSRSRPQTRFYCTKMIIQHRAPSFFSMTLGQIRISDVKGTNGSARFYYYPTKENPEPIVLDFSDCPRKFEGDSFDVYTQYSFAAGEFLIVSLFGWEEQP